MEVLYIGKVIRAHGLSGAVIVSAYADTPQSFNCDSRVLIDPEGDSCTLTIESISRHSGRIKVKFREIDSRTDAESLEGKQIAISQDQLRNLPEGDFYVFELVGCTIKNADGIVEGVVEDVINNPGNDLLLVTKSSKKHYIPFVREIIERIDLHKREITICSLEGLFD